MTSPVLKKAALQAGMRVYVAGAPCGFEAELGQLGDDGERASRLSGSFDLVYAFYTREAQLKRDLPKLTRALRPDGILWLSYPKDHAFATDLNRDVLRVAVDAIGLGTVVLAVIDAVWSAMRCTVRALVK